jgi:YegS/Rv2252/BmrU family lipid kinase
VRTVRVILNPASGPSRPAARGREEEGVERFRSVLERAGVRFELARTTGPGTSAGLAAAAARDGVSDVVAAGGDGTICEVAAGLLECGLTGTPRLGLWPRGTANVLAKHLGCPREAADAARIVLAGRTRPLRPGLLTGEETRASRVFFLMAGAGLDAEVLSRVQPRVKRIAGQAAFWWAGLTLPWRPVPFRVEANGGEYPATFLSVGRSPLYGGGFSVTPGAALDDALFEVAIVNSTSRARMTALAFEAWRGGLQSRPPEVTFVRTTAVRASGAPVAVQADGDLAGTLPARFSIASAALDVLVPGAPGSGAGGGVLRADAG